MLPETGLRGDEIEHATSDSIGIFYVTTIDMRQIQEYVSGDGKNPFKRWFDGLDNTASLKVTVALARLQSGNTSALKAIG